MKKINKKVKKMNVWDVGFVKWSVAAAVLFLLTVWPGLHDLVMRAHWGMVFRSNDSINDKTTESLFF